MNYLPVFLLICKKYNQKINKNFFFHIDLDGEQNKKSLVKNKAKMFLKEQNWQWKTMKNKAAMLKFLILSTK